jgi:hypothetical protein
MVGVPFGLIDLRSEAQFASALKSDTPTLVVERRPGRATVAALRLQRPPQVAPAGAGLAVFGER